MLVRVNSGYRLYGWLNTENNLIYRNRFDALNNNDFGIKHPTLGTLLELYSEEMELDTQAIQEAYIEKERN